MPSKRSASPNGIFPSRIRSHRLPTGEMSVFCWCERAIVYVRPEVIDECRTESCGREGCRG